MSASNLDRIKKRGPSFFRNWDFQQYQPLPDGFRSAGGKFIIAGLPKSGNVWLTSLVASALDLPVSPQEGKSLVTYVHKALTQELFADPLVFRGVVIVRDLRDILVSLFYWLKTEDYLSYYKHGPHQIFYDFETMYIEYFIRRFCHIPIASLVDDYVKYGWPVIKYERLCDDTHKELKRLFEIWRIDVADEKILDALKRNEIGVLRRASSAATVDKSIKPDHFRSGGYGQYKHELPKHICLDLERRFGDYLRSWGYQTSI